jgi:hypothetical protein
VTVKCESVVVWVREGTVGKRGERKGGRDSYHDTTHIFHLLLQFQRKGSTCLGLTFLFTSFHLFFLRSQNFVAHYILQGALLILGIYIKKRVDFIKQQWHTMW